MAKIKRKFAPSLVAGIFLSLTLALLRAVFPSWGISEVMVLLPALIGVFREVIVIRTVITPFIVAATILAVYYRMMGTGNVYTAMVDVNKMFGKFTGIFKQHPRDTEK